MTTKDVTNNTKGALGLPGGPVIRPGATVRVENFEKKESTVVKAWIDSKALTVKDAKGGEPAPAPANNGGNGGGNGSNDGQGNGDGNGGGTAFVAKSEDELRAMTNGEIAAYIEDKDPVKGLGGEVKSGMNKDDLVKLAVELQAKKVAG